MRKQMFFQREEAVFGRESGSTGEVCSRPLHIWDWTQDFGQAYTCFSMVSSPMLNFFLKNPSGLEEGNQCLCHYFKKLLQFNVSIANFQCSTAAAYGCQAGWKANDILGILMWIRENGMSESSHVALLGYCDIQMITHILKSIVLHTDHVKRRWFDPKCCVCGIRAKG